MKPSVFSSKSTASSSWSGNLCVSRDVERMCLYNFHSRMRVLSKNLSEGTRSFWSETKPETCLVQCRFRHRHVTFWYGLGLIRRDCFATLIAIAASMKAS
jgi:hypothetical protein